MGDPVQRTVVRIFLTPGVIFSLAKLAKVTAHWVIRVSGPMDRGSNPHNSECVFFLFLFFLKAPIDSFWTGIATESFNLIFSRLACNGEAENVFIS